jgi:tRNA nucleotidyltransferase/poly(A) polymerase
MGNPENNSLINECVFFILNLIERNGHEVRIVGGAVRDFLLGRQVSDIDMATSASPSEIIDICKQNGLTVIPIGLAHGSVAIIRGNNFYEITTLREDIKTFGRRAEVKFSKSFEADSLRRDFTINAMYMDKEGRIYDYHSGKEDIWKKNIRFIGDARRRISEDYLRILRYFRFVAGYGDYRCRAEYLQAIDEAKHCMNMLSSERIVAELLKIFKISDSYRIIPPMRPVLDTLFSLKCDPFEICEKLGIFGLLSDEERVAMLLRFSSDCNTMGKKYNFSKSIREMIMQRFGNNTSLDASKQSLKRTKKSYRNFFSKFLAVNFYIIAGEDGAKSFLQQLLAFCNSDYADFLLKGSDLDEYRLSEAQLAEVMRAAKNFWLNNLVSTKECGDFARQYISSSAIS